MSTYPLYTDTIYNRPMPARSIAGTPENTEERLRRFRMHGEQDDSILIHGADAIRDLLAALALVTAERDIAVAQLRELPGPAFATVKDAAA
ncbi:hypothetical protein [Arthrobacter sp. VKM Ac-2550]|uniref:hypothetical protein n=1 Tax=Crystallibacter permensis TaxID=1938888 RepID=UPI002226ED7E|nr:hypothetical protein [Arthrobacter sp. VKM Ac-2550]MCW2132912.1 hypothetical protein [Arthrobacter sp. VKM Ac-2550]